MPISPKANNTTAGIAAASTALSNVSFAMWWNCPSNLIVNL